MMAPDKGGSTGSSVRGTIKPEVAEELRRNLLFRVLRPVLEEGGRFGEQITYHQAEGDFLGWDVSTPNGTFTFLITNDEKPKDEELGETVPEYHYDGNRMTGTALFQERWLTSEKLKDKGHLQLLQGIARALMIGDPDVSPHMRARTANADEESVLSYIQRENHQKSTEQLEAYKKANPKRVPRVGVFGPGGIGKTILFSGLARYVFERNQDENGLIIFAVESEEVLNSAFEKLTRELGLKPNQVWNYYGRYKQNQPLGKPKEVRVLLTTRTGLNSLCRAGTLLREVIGKGKTKRSVVLGLDEAQHVPAAKASGPGQFLEALRFFEGEIGDTPAKDKIKDRVLDENDAIICISATMTHSQNPGLIRERRFLDRSIVGMFLTDEETEQLKNGDHQVVMELAARQVRRAMALGYLAWINFVDTKPVNDPAGRSVLNRKVVEINEKTHQPELKEVVEPTLIKDVVDKILENRKKNPHMMQRALIFVEGTHRSNLFAEMLQEELRKREEGVEFDSVVHPFHSKAGSFDDTSDWLQDRQVRRVNGRGNIVLGTDYGTDQDKATHKFAVVDSIVGEGADLPNVNMIIIARDVNDKDTGSVARLYQNILRGTRVYPFKQRLFLIDYSLVVNAFLMEQLKLKKLSGAPRPSEPGGPKPKVTGAVAHDLHAQIQDEIADLILAAQSGKPTEYGNIPPEEVFLLRRAHFLMSRPEGQELAQASLGLVKAVASLDLPRITAETRGRKMVESLNRQGLSALGIQYVALRDQILQHFEEHRSFLRMVDAGDFAGNEDFMEEQRQELRDKANELSGSTSIYGFWNDIKKWMEVQDPLRRVPLTLDLHYVTGGRGDTMVIENLVALYQELHGTDSRLQDREHQTFDVSVLGPITEYGAKIRISGTNVWPYLFRETGLHVWPNQMRGGRPHAKTVDAHFDGKPDNAKLLLLPRDIAAFIENDNASPTSSNARHVRNYDIKNNLITSQDDYPMPGPMSARSIQRSGRLVLTEQGREDFVNIFRRNACLYYLALVQKHFDALKPFLPPEPPAEGGQQ